MSSKKQVVTLNPNHDLDIEVAAATSQLSLFKVSKNETLEIIRPEANLEKWQSFIFPHTKAKNIDEKRIFSYDIVNGDRTLTASITVNPASGQNTTTSRSYDVYLALIAIWDKNGLGDEPFLTSIREIIKHMGIAQSGENYHMVREELEILFTCTISWKMSYSAVKKNKESVSLQNVLETYDYVSVSDRFDQTDKFDQVCRIQLDKRIRDNHRVANTNPLIWSVRKKIRSPIAKVFYSRLDTFLNVRPFYDRKAINIVKDLMLSEERYKYKSQRLVLLKKLVKSLDGKRLSSLKVLALTIEPTVDGKDYKLICRTKNDRQIQVQNGLQVVNKDKKIVDQLINMIGNRVGAREKNWKYYHILATYYDEDLISYALNELEAANQELSKKPLSSRLKYFTAIMHRCAHQMGKDWIKACSGECRYRPENQKK